MNQVYKKISVFLLLFSVISMIHSQQVWRQEVKVNSIDTTKLNASLCLTGIYFFGGRYITTPGIYYDILTNTNYCDSIIVLNLTDSTTYYSYIHQMLVEDSYVFGNKILQHPGVYYDTILMKNGCDSIVELTLIVYDTTGLAICGYAYDYEGNLYVGKNLAGLCWLNRNMFTQHNSSGNPISSWIYNQSPYNDTVSNLDKFGRLYNWETVQELCPIGWRLPTAAEYLALIQSYPSADIKKQGPNYWLGEIVTNSTQLSLVPSGYYDSAINTFYQLLGDVYLWTSESVSSSIALACHLYFNCPSAYIVQCDSGWGMSVRCVK